MKHHEIKAPTILEPELLNKVFVVREAIAVGSSKYEELMSSLVWLFCLSQEEVRCSRTCEAATAYFTIYAPPGEAAAFAKCAMHAVAH